MWALKPSITAALKQLFDDVIVLLRKSLSQSREMYQRVGVLPKTKSPTCQQTPHMHIHMHLIYSQMFYSFLFWDGLFINLNLPPASLGVDITKRDQAFPKG